MTKLYMVTKGEYSDYGVVGIFSTIDNAQLIVDRINNAEYVYSKAEIEEVTLDPNISEIKAGLNTYSVQLYKSGDIYCIYSFDNDDIVDDYMQICNRLIKNTYKEILIIHIWAKDSDHAIKIAGERHMMIMADNMWEVGRLFEKEDNERTITTENS